MFNLIELEHFVTFAECGTLTKAAEKLNISQPTLTRSMKHIEDEFNVSLFTREKNRITLNETGKKAVEYVAKLLQDASNCITSIQEYNRQLHTITVKSCAPAPLWSLIPKLSTKYPENEIASKIDTIDNIIRDVNNKSCDLGVLPFDYKSYIGDIDNLENDIIDVTFLEENLSVCVPHNSELAKYDTLTFSDINGYNCLLKDKIGFWTKMCFEKMPASRFLIQTNDFDFQELVKTSTLLCFVTNFATNSENIMLKRKIIPITDIEANVTYHLISAKQMLI